MDISLIVNHQQIRQALRGYALDFNGKQFLPRAPIGAGRLDPVPVN